MQTCSTAVSARFHDTNWAQACCAASWYLTRHITPQNASRRQASGSWMSACSNEACSDAQAGIMQKLASQVAQSSQRCPKSPTH